MRLARISFDQALFRHEYTSIREESIWALWAAYNWSAGADIRCDSPTLQPVEHISIAKLRP